MVSIPQQENDYSASSVIRTPSAMVHLGSVQKSEFVRISEIHSKINSKHHMMMQKISPQSG